VPDTWFAIGGCSIINGFDCLGKTGNGRYAASYPDYGDYSWYAAIGTDQIDYDIAYPHDTFCVDTIRTMWFGHSLQYLRDDGAPNAPIDRFHIARDVINWMGGGTNTDITKADNVPLAYGLSQNYPNPCNPSTTIKFDMKEKGHVTLRIYNVAGQLVCTLHDGVMDAGRYTLTWDGKNNRGASVASGIYFYKMETRSFNKTRKLVVLR
jgi:hypothetical protein